MRRTAPVSAPKEKSIRREPGATGQNSRQPEGLQPESTMAALLVLAIERLLPSPGALPSPILAATHTCFTVLETPNAAGFNDAIVFGILARKKLAERLRRPGDDRHPFAGETLF